MLSLAVPKLAEGPERTYEVKSDGYRAQGIKTAGQDAIDALEAERVGEKVADFATGTGWPEAVTRLRLPQNVACRFPALRSSEVDSQRSERLQLPIWEMQFRSQ
jgi:hypothetical protein